MVTDTNVFGPFLIGFVPILLARTWRARRAAIRLGLVPVGLAVYCVFSSPGSDLSDSFDVFRRTVLPMMGALITALVSAIVTYRLDKKHDAKP
jgi:hypothetical protein